MAGPRRDLEDLRVDGLALGFAVPALLLPAFDGVAPNRAAVAEALQHSAIS